MQTEPGPIPTLIMSAPAKINSSTISAVTTFPAIIVLSGHCLRARLTNSTKNSEYPFATSTQIYLMDELKAKICLVFSKSTSLVPVLTAIFCSYWVNKWVKINTTPKVNQPIRRLTSKMPLFSVENAFHSSMV